MIKQFGVQQATQFHDFVMAHIPALKEVVETEGIDCEFELRRSYDVFLDQAEADQAKQEFMASLRNGESWTEDRDDIGAELAEQVSESVIPYILFHAYETHTTGNIYERS